MVFLIDAKKKRTRQVVIIQLYTNTYVDIEGPRLEKWYWSSEVTGLTHLHSLTCVPLSCMQQLHSFPEKPSLVSQRVLAATHNA